MAGFIGILSRIESLDSTGQDPDSATVEAPGRPLSDLSKANGIITFELKAKS